MRHFQVCEEHELSKVIIERGFLVWLVQHTSKLECCLYYGRQV